jgi:phage tail protein X
MSIDVTAAMWTPPLWAQPAANPVPMLEERARRADAALRDPRVLTALVIVGLILVVGFRHSISRSIGTAGDPPPVVSTTFAHLLRPAPLARLPRAATTPVIVKLHPPRDPLLPLIGAPTTTTVTTAALTAPVVEGPTYRVRRGDSLWAIARRGMSRHASTPAVSARVRAIYDANRVVIGPNPSALRVGIELHLPAAG